MFLLIDDRPLKDALEQMKSRDRVCEACTHWGEGWCDCTSWKTSGECVCPREFGSFSPITWGYVRKFDKEREAYFDNLEAVRLAEQKPNGNATPHND